MDNNKNRVKDRKKSNPELRKMEPKDNADVGIINGKKSACMAVNTKKIKQNSDIL